MKVGDLVLWTNDGDIGIIVGFVGEDYDWDSDPDPEWADIDNPIIKWNNVPLLDSSISQDDGFLEVLNESR